MSTDSMLGAAAPAAARAAAPAAAPSGGTWNVSVEIPLAPASVGLYMGLYDALSPAAANEDRSGGGKDRSGGGNPTKKPRLDLVTKATHHELHNAYNSGYGDGYQTANVKAGVVIKNMESEMLEKIQDLETKVNVCFICTDKAPNVCFSVCGHAMCDGCEKLLRPQGCDGKIRCPKCSRPVYGNGNWLINLFL
jgi:hypothetical protein